MSGDEALTGHCEAGVVRLEPFRICKFGMAEAVYSTPTTKTEPEA